MSHHCTDTCTATVVLVDGRAVCSSCEECRHECEARWILSLKPLAHRQDVLADIERSRSKDAADALRDTMQRTDTMTKTVDDLMDRVDHFGQAFSDFILNGLPDHATVREQLRTAIEQALGEEWENGRCAGVELSEQALLQAHKEGFDSALLPGSVPDEQPRMTALTVQQFDAAWTSFLSNAEYAEMRRVLSIHQVRSLFADFARAIECKILSTEP